MQTIIGKYLQNNLGLTLLGVTESRYARSFRMSEYKIPGALVIGVCTSTGCGYVDRWHRNITNLTEIKLSRVGLLVLQ